MNTSEHTSWLLQHKRKLIAFGLVVIAFTLFARDFEAQPFKYAKLFYRIMHGTTFEVQGRIIPIPDQCYLFEKSTGGTDGKPETTFGCELGARKFLGVTIFTGYSPEEIEARRKPNPLFRNRVEMDHFFSFDVLTEDAPTKPVSFYFLPKLGVLVSPDDKELAKPFIDALLAATNPP